MCGALSLCNLIDFWNNSFSFPFWGKTVRKGGVEVEVFVSYSSCICNCLQSLRHISVNILVRFHLFASVLFFRVSVHKTPNTDVVRV